MLGAKRFDPEALASIQHLRRAFLKQSDEKVIFHGELFATRSMAMLGQAHSKELACLPYISSLLSIRPK